MSKQHIMMTRAEIEEWFQQRYEARIVTYSEPSGKPTTGKIHRIGVETALGEPMVIFILDHTRYECDIIYFKENITIHGNTHTAGGGSPGV